MVYDMIYLQSVHHLLCYLIISLTWALVVVYQIKTVSIGTGVGGAIINISFTSTSSISWYTFTNRSIPNDLKENNNIWFCCDCLNSLTEQVPPLVHGLGSHRWVSQFVPWYPSAQEQKWPFGWFYKGVRYMTSH